VLSVELHYPTHTHTTCNTKWLNNAVEQIGGSKNQGAGGKAQTKWKTKAKGEVNAKGEYKSAVFQRMTFMPDIIRLHNRITR